MDSEVEVSRARGITRFQATRAEEDDSDYANNPGCEVNTLAASVDNLITHHFTALAYLRPAAPGERDAIVK